MRDKFIMYCGLIVVAAIVALGFTGVVWLMAFLIAHMPK